MSFQAGNPSRTLGAFIVVVWLLGLTVSNNAIAGSFNAVSDFSLASNPNVVWSYGYQSAFGPSLTLYTATDSSPGVYSAWLVSGTPYYAHPPYVTRNDTNGNLCRGTFCVPKASLHLHPDSTCAYSVVRFTAPASGTSQIKGDFAGIDSSGPAMGRVRNVYVVCNGTVVFTSTINSYLVLVPFTLTCTLAVGQALDFAVGCGDGNYDYDSTALRCKVYGGP
jgi:hypothetical protein